MDGVALTADAVSTKGKWLFGCDERNYMALQGKLLF